MSTQTTISQLKELGLHGMAEAFEAMMVLPSQKRPGLDRAVEKMVQMEACMRDKRLTERLLKAAKLRYKVFIEDITCSALRSAILQKANWRKWQIAASYAEGTICSSPVLQDVASPISRVLLAIRLALSGYPPSS